MRRPLTVLLHEARILLDLGSQGALGVLLDSSEHTGQRWARGQATPMAVQLQKLAAMVFPKDEQLAAEIALASGRTLQQIGLVRPAPVLAPPPPPPPPPPDPVHIVDTVVCAAADAMQLVPDAVRPALRAAFRRARLAGLTVEAVDTALARSAAAADTGSATTKTGPRPATTK